MDSAQLYLHTSNRLDQLAQSLVAVSREQALSSPLECEQVMVQNAGIARWLRYQIASIDGVAMNWEFPFTAKVISRIASSFEPDFETNGSFDPDIARWAIFELLSNMGESKSFDLVRSYIEGDEKKRLKFATRLAQLFDEYLVYRPDIILDWEKGNGSPAWMREIWRRLIQFLYGNTESPPHIARVWKLAASKNADATQSNTLPSRLFVFGFSTLPPLQLDLLKAAAHLIPVHVFLLQPTNLYWADLRGNKQARAERRKRKKKAVAELPPDVGNPLLPAWGKQSQEFLDALIDRDVIQFDDGFLEPVSDTQLHALQSDLYYIRDRSSAKADQFDLFDESIPPFPEFDSSIEIHASFSETRECEALHDFLIQSFHDLSDLLPGEILVMAPDIDRYRHAIESVFSSDSDPRRQIPYSISDNQNSQTSEVHQGLIAFFGLPLGRLSSEEMLDFFSLPLIRKRCVFSDRDLEAIENWIRAIGTTWGWNADRRSDQGAFPSETNTWKELRARLSLGLAMGTEDELWNDILPFPNLEGESALLAGRLLDLLHVIDLWISSSKASKAVSEWNQDILNTISYFDSAFDEYDLVDYAQLVDQIEKILPSQEPASISGMEICALLAQELDRESSRSSLFNGKVSFCSLKPMRNVPARIICVLGLNADEFPRIRRRPNFDIMNFDTRPGDRSQKDEDKQLFLEAVLSAQDRLFISYQQASLSSDDTREPSSVLQDLIDYLHAANNEKSETPSFLIKHRRLSYDESYFDTQSRLFTYSRDRARLCELAGQGRQSTRIVDSSTISFNRRSSDEILNLEQLIAFFKHPQKAFLRQTIEALFIDGNDALLDADFLNLPPLSRYKLRDLARDWLESESDRFSNSDIIAADKLLPPGFASKLQYHELRDEALALKELISQQTAESETSHMTGIIQIASGEVEGTVSTTSNGKQILVEAGKLNANRYLETWIRHQFANRLAGSVDTRVYSISEPNKELHFGSSSFDDTVLDAFISTMEEGLSTPLPFFPEVSFEYAKTLAKSGSDSAEAQDDAWRKIASKLSDPSHSSKFGMSLWDSYVSACFKPDSIDRDQFHRCATNAFLPILQSIEETSSKTK